MHWKEPIGKTSVKLLTLKQLKETIQDIYEEKQKYDEICWENRTRLETMEQFLFSHLNNKYGLKNLAIEYAAGIVSSVKAYAHEDPDVLLFGKILKNEIEEDYRFVQ